MSDDRATRRNELCGAPIDDPSSAGLIDDYYTDFTVSDEDRDCLKRFLTSSDLGVRDEALRALAYATEEGAPVTGYAVDALILHLLSVISEPNSSETGLYALLSLERRGDEQARYIVKSLRKNQKWRRDIVGDTS